MNVPITSDDIITRKTTDSGGVKESFDRAKAAKSILAKMDLTIEIFDSKDPQPEIWYYGDGYWHPGGAPLIGYYLDKVAGNQSNNENIKDVLRSRSSWRGSYSRSSSSISQRFSLVSLSRISM